MPPQVSVVVPVYNAAEFLRETLDSVLAQDYSGFETLVVDDGSTDDSASVAESFGEKVRVIRTPNRGVASARNTGIQEATGQYVAFLDSDDIWEPNKLTVQMGLIDDNHQLAYSDTVSFGIDALNGSRMSGGGTLPSGDILPELVENNFVATSSVVIRRELAIRLGGFEPELKICQDWNLWLKAAQVTQIACSQEPLVRYRLRAGSLGGDLERRLLECERVIETGIQMLGLEGTARTRLRQRALAGCYDYAALLAEFDGDSALARRYRVTAAKTSISLGRIKELIKSAIGPAWTDRLRKLKNRGGGALV